MTYNDPQCGDLTLMRAEAVVAEKITFGSGCIITGTRAVRPTADSRLYFLPRRAGPDRIAAGVGHAEPGVVTGRYPRGVNLEDAA